MEPDDTTTPPEDANTVEAQPFATSWRSEPEPDAKPEATPEEEAK